MPADFTECVAEGGRVRTVKPNASTYIKICYDKSGKSHTGETHYIGEKGGKKK